MRVRVLFLALLLGWVSGPVRAEDDFLPSLVQMLAGSEDSRFQLDLLKGMSDGLRGRRGVPMPAGWDALAEKLVRSPNAQVRDLAQSLSLTFGSPAALSALRAVLLDRKAAEEVRQRALDALAAARDPGLARSLREIIRENNSLRGPALRALAAFDDPETPSAILKLYPTFDEAERHDALNTLAARSSFAKQLGLALGEKRFPAKDLTADVVRQLRQFKDSGLDQQIQKWWGISRETAADKLQEIAKFKAVVAARGYGEPSRGRVIFARTCQQCHTLFGEGGKVGPDLTGSNRGDLDYLLQNVIDPNAVIPNDYRTSTLETTDDRVIVGIVIRKDDRAVTIVVPGETILVPRNEIKSLTQGEVSMMPEGLLQALSEADVRDLLAYLHSPTQVPLPKGSVPAIGK